MFLFEDGEIESEAYVEINGNKYPVHMPKYKGNTPLTSENINKAQIELLKMAFPIGSQYVTQDETNPKEILNFGTWERLKGKVCLGLDENDTDLNAIGKTGGEKTHKLTVEEMPSHRHNFQKTDGVGWNALVDDGSNSTFGCKIEQHDGYNAKSCDMNNTGGDKPHNNMQPYEVVGYMWIRRG